MDTRKNGQWQHKYVERDLPDPSRPPRGPWAVHLSSSFGRYRWLLFDLDDKRGDVGPDLATLLRWLEEAGLTYVVAASGSAGGRHVWVTAQSLLEAHLVHSIAEAAHRRLPTLDHGLLKSRTGAARPIGAPHRGGGRSELLWPADGRQAAALLTPASCGNDSEAFTRLLLIIETIPAPADVRPKVVGADLFAEVLDDEQGLRLAGTARTVLDDTTMALLTRRPAEDRVSEELARLLVRLALRRWSWPMVHRLLGERRYREGGLLHACTRSEGRGVLRTVLDDDQAVEKLAEQWEKCVAYAARLPLPPEAIEFSNRIDDVVALVVRVQEAADACPERWSTEAGPADRAALDLLCLLALRAGRSELDLDVRRAALATGHGRSTMHRALQRLALDGWIRRRGADTGSAAGHDLLDVTDAAHPHVDSETGGGTQGNPPPQGKTRDALIEALQVRLSAGQAEVFAHGRLGGLGHHTARTYQVLAVHAHRPLTVAELSAATGYSARATARHLARMRDLLVVRLAVMTVHHECPQCQALPGERCTVNGRPVTRRAAGHQHARRDALARTRAGTPHYRVRNGSLTAAAKALGTWGVTASRARRYAIEREVYHWWLREEAWMRTAKAGIRTGVQVHDEQTALVLTTLPRQPRRRYPRTADRRGDHAAARARIERHIAVA
ncbi:hypothetical protein ACIRO1_45405 [Streptomyces sp. NPDC102381]|uniref:hypothetical protein n=1 Tax=Streptomyces sp. NPDC102381 TaxID=3366164 RepID=UPI003805CDDD